MTEPATADTTAKRVRGRPFVKGQPRPAGAGRRRGAANKATKDIREFIQGVTLGDKTFCDNLAAFCKSPKVWEKPHMVAVLFAYGFGKAVPMTPAAETRSPLLFITQHNIGSYDPLAEKAAALAARAAERKALVEGSKPEAFTPPKGDEPAGEALEVVDPGSIAERLMARPK